MLAFTTRRNLLAAGGVAGFILMASIAAAQQAAPLPPGSPLIGRPENNPAAAQLAPVAPPPIPTAADKLPTAKLKLPKGFKIEVWASGVPNARTMRLGDKGTVFVGNRFV